MSVVQWKQQLNSKSDSTYLPIFSRIENIPVAPVVFTAVSAVSTLALLYLVSSRGSSDHKKRTGALRSATLPGFGILGDRVNEFIEIFLDALAVYVHNDRKWDCQRKLLCEANQRAADNGAAHGIIMYFTSLLVSFLLRDQLVSESMEAMKRGRQGEDCSFNYPQCPFSL